jgi:hypothetical protein
MPMGAADDQNVNESCIRRAIQCHHLNGMLDMRLQGVKI